MGRHRKYISEEERVVARRARQMKYHWRNRDDRNRGDLDRYYDKKNSLYNDFGDRDEVGDGNGDGGQDIRGFFNKR